MDGAFPQQNGEAEDQIDLREVVHILRRNLWLISGSCILAVTLAVGYAFLATPIYETGTSIRIDEKQSNLPVLDVLKTLSTGSEVGTEMEVLRSRTLAEAVVDTLDLQFTMVRPRRISRNQILDLIQVSQAAPEAVYRFERQGDRFAVTNHTTGESLGAYKPGERIILDGATIVLAPAALDHNSLRFQLLLHEKAVEALHDDIRVTRPNREANMVMVRYRSPDTILVRQVPNVLAQQYIAQRQLIKSSAAGSTVHFLRQQIDTLTTQLTAAEDELRKFREGKQVVSLEAEASTQVREFAALQAQRNQLDAERSALAELLTEVRAAPVAQSGESSPFRRLIAFPSLLRNQAASELLRSLAVVENERALLLQRRTTKDSDVQILSARVRELEEQLRSIAITYLQGLTNQVGALDATLGRSELRLAAIPAKEVQFARLKRQATVLEDIYTMLQTRLKEAEIAQAVEDPNVRVVDSAARPVKPVRPRKTIAILLGVILGSLVGVSLAFLRDLMDTTVRTREDVQEITGVPVLGLIPRISAAAMNGASQSRATGAPAPSTGIADLETRLVTGRDPRNPVSEAYRSLRTNITFIHLERTPKTLVFTSPTPGDGKSTSSANLAITLTQQGLKVLLIDADLRRGVGNTIFNTNREPGLSNAILGAATISDAVRSKDLGPSGVLDFLPTGTLPPNPAELLGSERMRALLKRLEQTYDAIILDAPPLTLVTDAAILGTNADGVIVVARAGQTHRGALSYAMEQLRNVRAPVLGAVLNDIDFKRDSSYYGRYGSYGYYYGSEER